MWCDGNDGRVGCATRSDRLFLFLKKEDDLTHFSWQHYARYHSDSKWAMSLGTQRVPEKYETDVRTGSSLLNIDFEILTCDYWSFCAACSTDFDWNLSLSQLWASVSYFSGTLWYHANRSGYSDHSSNSSVSREKCVKIKTWFLNEIWI